MGTCIYCSSDGYQWGGMSWVASLCPLLAGNAEPRWHMPAPRLGYDGLPPPPRPPIEAKKEQVFGWHHSKRLSSSSTDPVHPQRLAVTVVASLPECQLRAELLKGEEHMGVWRDSTPLGLPAGRDFTKPSSSLGRGWRGCGDGGSFPGSTNPSP